MRHLLAAIVLAPIGLSASCTSERVNCDASCERVASACGDASVPCLEACSTSESVSRELGCSAEYQALVACDGDQDPSASCKRETCDAFLPWNDCIESFCTTHATDKGCRLLACENGLCSPYGRASQR